MIGQVNVIKQRVSVPQSQRGSIDFQYPPARTLAAAPVVDLQATGQCCAACNVSYSVQLVCYRQEINNHICMFSSLMYAWILITEISAHHALFEKDYLCAAICIYSMNKWLRSRTR